LGVLRYRGRRTHQTRELVVQCVREGDCVWILPGQPDRKRWWRNMLEPCPVEMWLAGDRLSGVAHVVTDTSDGELERGLGSYRSVFSGVNEATVMVRVDVAHGHPTDQGGEQFPRRPAG
jgi:hypothetical protein